MYIKKQPELVSSEIKESIIEEAKVKKIKNKRDFLKIKLLLTKKFFLIQ